MPHPLCAPWLLRYRSSHQGLRSGLAAFRFSLGFDLPLAPLPLCGSPSVLTFLAPLVSPALCPQAPPLALRSPGAITEAHDHFRVSPILTFLWLLCLFAVHIAFDLSAALRFPSFIHCGRLHRVFRPGVLRVARPQFLAHLGVGPLPESRQVVGDLGGTEIRRQ